MGRKEVVASSQIEPSSRVWDGLTRAGRPNLDSKELSRAYVLLPTVELAPPVFSGPRLRKNRERGLKVWRRNSLLALVRTGIENDFEEVVFPQHPLLREIKRELMEWRRCSVCCALWVRVRGVWTLPDRCGSEGGATARTGAWGRGTHD